MFAEQNLQQVWFLRIGGFLNKNTICTHLMLNLNLNGPDVSQKTQVHNKTFTHLLQKASVEQKLWSPLDPKHDETCRS